MKIYFAGSIRGGRNDRSIYKQLIAQMSEYAVVLTEHVGSENLNYQGEKKMADTEIYERDVDWVREADILVAEVSTPSLGVGYEIGYAEQLDKKIICLYRKNADHRLSAMIAGNQYIQVLEYDEVGEVGGRLEEYLNDT